MRGQFLQAALHRDSNIRTLVHREWPDIQVEMPPEDQLLLSNYQQQGSELVQLRPQRVGVEMLFQQRAQVAAELSRHSVLHGPIRHRSHDAPQLARHRHAGPLFQFPKRADAVPDIP